MTVRLMDDNNITAWQAEVDLGISVLEALEFALKKAKTMGGAAEHCRDIDDAIYGITGVTARATLKVERLRREADEPTT